ncbi:hypothetical protein JCM1841_004859 [Sporobolomyces salmonicolor]
MKAPVLVLALSATAVLAHDLHQPRHLDFVHAREGGMQLLRKRQGVSIPALQDATSAATTPAAAATVTSSAAAAAVATASSSAAAVVTSSSAAPVVPVVPVTSSSSSESEALTSSSSSSAPAPAEVVSSSSSTTLAAAISSSSSSAPLSSSSSSSTAPALSSSKESASLSSDSTVTSTDSPSSGSSTGTSSSASSTSSSDNSSSNSGGLGHGTLIAIIVVASCVAGVAAIWTIIRKTKFSPSRRFEAKLEPIDFVDPYAAHGQADRGGDAILEHQRSQSVMSGGYAGMGAGYAGSLARSDSGKGSLRGMGMSESSQHLPTIPYGGPAYVQAPYYGGGGYSPPPQPGYPHEQSYGYADLQRGNTLGSRSMASPPATTLARMDTARSAYGGAASPGPGAYDYAAQARAGQRY